MKGKNIGAQRQILDINPRASLICPRRPHHQVYRLHQARWNNHQVKLHQLMSSMDQLLVAELNNYNKRCTRYFVKFHLLMRIIYFLNRACCYYSGSPRRMTRTRRDWTREENYVEPVRPGRTVMKKQSYLLIHRSCEGPWVLVGKVLKSTF